MAAEPSFDCKRATTDVEKSVCGSEALAKADSRLSALYFSLLEKADGPAKKQLQNDQRLWLKNWDGSCSLKTLDQTSYEQCLLARYRQRHAELSYKHTTDAGSRSDTADPLRVLRVTPNGQDVPASRQIVIQFDRPVAPIGRMERRPEEIPVEIAPKINCEWRWLNTSALSCQLRAEDAMQKATRYTIRVNPGIITTEGVVMGKPYVSEFITSRPKVHFTRFVNWLTPGTPLIQVTFNMPVTKESVENVLSMHARNVAGSQKVGVIAYPDTMKRNTPFWPNDGQNLYVNDQNTTVNGKIARKVWIVKPEKALPLDQTIWFDVNQGLVSSEGNEKGIENRTIISFETYPEFAFLGLRCTLKGKRHAENISYEQLLAPEKTVKECAPLKPVAFLFSAPVRKSVFKDAVDFTPPLDGGRKDYDPWENSRDSSRLSSPHRTGRTYQVWLPELLQAHETYNIRIKHDKLLDEFGRKPGNTATKTGNDSNFTFYTAHREPRLRLLHSHAVLEKKVDTDLPLYVTNLDSVTFDYQGLNDTGGKINIPVQKIEDIAYKMPMGIRDILKHKSSAVYGKLRPVPTPADYWGDPTLFAQVTPFQVHAKFGHFNSLVWISDFANGGPVASAKVTLCKGSYTDLRHITELPYRRVSDREGLVQLPGTETLDPDLVHFRYWIKENGERFFLKVEKGGDVALLPVDSDFKVHSSGTYSAMRRYGQHTHAWGTTAQGVYKLGDTVEYKIYVRDQSNTHWVSPDKDGYTLEVYDPQQKVVHKSENIRLNAFGAFDGEFTIPPSGTVGEYLFVLKSKKQLKTGEKSFRWQPMSVLVSDFTPSPFKAKTELNGESFKAGDTVTVTSRASLHSGGAFSNAEVRLTARLSKKPFATDAPAAKGFRFGDQSGSYLSAQQSRLLDVRATLDDKGEYAQQFTLPETGIYYGSILVESAVKDERGKFVASLATADFSGRDRFVGLRNTRWIYKKGEDSAIEVLVVNEEGQPVAGTKVNVIVQHRTYKAARVKGPGNAYLTQNIMSWENEQECSLVSSRSAGKCTFRPKHPGSYQFIATIKDTKGREHQTTIGAWVSGRGHVVWDQSNDATLQIIPEQTGYKVGDKARYLIKNPFPGAKALVSIERYGVLDAWVQTLETSTPVIEVPVKPEYLPGYYLSVVVVSPRVAKPLGKNQVDLGKPSYRMGYIQSRVRDAYKELDVHVSTEKAVYKPRDTVKATISIDAGKLKDDEPCEIAVAVVDESVLALNKNGNGYYDPYLGFNRLDALDVSNYSLISRLIGRQKFEKKGASQGGDGGAATAYSQLRDLFKYVTYWNPSITPGEKRNAQIEFELPDNLTGWRILAFALTPDDKMGLGATSFKVNRPTEIRPVMPNQVLEGDSFKAGFNVMNRTGRTRKLSLQIEVDGPELTPSKKSFELELKPYARKNVWLPLHAPAPGELVFKARGGDRFDSDALEHKLTIHKKRSLETAATYGSTTRGKTTEWVQIPEGIHDDVGRVGVVLSPSVIGNLDGAFKYLKEYPYLCWEQRLTKAVTASTYLELKAYLKEELKWEDPKGVVASTLQSAADFQAQNGGMCYWTASNAHVSPYLSAYTALAFQWLARDGYEIPESVQKNLHQYLLRLLRYDELPSFYSKGMGSSVRAVALHALAMAGEIDEQDIRRYRPHVAQMDLFGKAHFLQAAFRTKGAEHKTKAEVLDAILGHASQSGGKFQFNEVWDDSYSYILSTPMRSNCSILSTLLSARNDPEFSKKIDDIPFKMVRSITQTRGNRDHWENTQENLFCLNAIVDYANANESTAPSMTVDVSFDDRKIGDTAFAKKSDPAVKIFRELNASDPGKKARIEIDKTGEGRLYYSAQVAYDMKTDHASRINAGIEIRREYSIERDGKFVLLKNPVTIRRSDLVKVDLFVSVPTARHFVVVHDPVPGGLEPVNSDLATSSYFDAEKGAFKAAEGSWWFTLSNWSYYGRYFWSFYHKELKHDAANFYADYLPAGNYHLSYTAQAIAEGEFQIMAAHAEEMYDPDVYGKSLPMMLKVGE
jgi:uncharacterized protein YfaS (alpha-2-macroglobulin family)/uncharacterized protein